jgi:hypothetical protein
VRWLSFWISESVRGTGAYPHVPLTLWNLAAYPLLESLRLMVALITAVVEHFPALIAIVVFGVIFVSIFRHVVRTF